MKAIRDTGNDLIAMYDPLESREILNQFFPEAKSFSDFNTYSAFHHEEKLSLKTGESSNLQNPIDYLSICSPNHVHFDQISWGLQQQAHIICEKPLVIDPAQLPLLQALENESGKKINTILQLRLLPAVIKLKNDPGIQSPGKKIEVKIEYITSRSDWYFNSWKGKEELSGGIVTNIGIHLFDLLIWLFGEVEEVSLKDYRQIRITL
jgi:UDP-N-acetyl-2-amino-2-deoxyglucuronate dehydrogenase